MANHYEVPNWAGKPPVGLHLDVLKSDKLIQKLMVDEKKCYLFGRNQQLNDFCIDHASCSRVHSALVYHKHLNRAFLVDLGSNDEMHKPTRKRKKKGITFNDDEEVINPEDIDPSVGRFRNLVQTTVVPSKRMRMEGGLISLSEDHNLLKHMQPTSTTPQLYHDLPPEQFSHSSMSAINPFSTALTSLTSRLGIALPNPAPEVEMTPNQIQTEAPHVQELPGTTEPRSMEPKKKKYAKEAWPGKKPMPTLLV
ncbi:nuclear inhibitor of protein phosphatase 1 isoform X3 [Ooceraea biroi]|uniref:nuclear inhibitor of protein phosphatase 1 isoform X3 n=1 Tax=Ooceraea biroi TaxID=2015173 RepID=UPI0009716D2E|nr:nuclear inhibitor of protein phosphatase 1 isoform X3 [Ooceraea biroi]